jgi:hypothetical protein
MCRLISLVVPGYMNLATDIALVWGAWQMKRPNASAINASANGSAGRHPATHKDTASIGWRWGLQRVSTANSLAVHAARRLSAGCRCVLQSVTVPCAPTWPTISTHGPCASSVGRAPDEAS